MLGGPGDPVRVVMRAPGWGPSGEYLERTLTPTLRGICVHHYAVRNTPGGTVVDRVPALYSAIARAWGRAKETYGCHEGC